ncbi:transporter [Xanthomonas campestris pv. phormiicola]|nr:transporter [Xanthomonas campestris pv. phormiicola]UYC16281.1 transporter [Xanthomonas campestris pv. phormiicola]
MRDTFNRIQRWTLLVIGACALVAASAHASETPIYGGPIGGTDIGGAYLPPQPGLYLAGVFADAKSDRYYDRNRDRLPIDTTFAANAAVLGALYVYPGTFLGGSLASSAQIGFGQRCLRFGTRSCTSGATDLYTDVVFWSRFLGSAATAPGAGGGHLPYGLVVGGGLGVTAPTGAYSKARSANTGGNIFIVSPNVAATYLTGPNFLGGDGTEISGRLFYSSPRRNDATGFDAGAVVDLDWALTQRYGNWQVGLTGQQAEQIENDRLADGQRSGALKFSQGTVGPMVAVFVPSIGSFVKVKLTFGYDTKNTFDNTGLYVIVSRKAF